MLSQVGLSLNSSPLQLAPATDVFCFSAGAGLTSLLFLGTGYQLLQATGLVFVALPHFPLPTQSCQLWKSLVGGVGWGGVTQERNWREKRPASKSFQISGSGPPMVAGKPHSTHPALHLGIHADMVWRIVNLKKSATQSPVVYGGSVCVDTENRNEK